MLDTARPEADRLADQMIANHQAIKALREGETFSEDEIRAVADHQGRLMADMMVLHARVHTEIRDILTPEQSERFKKLRQRHRGEGRHSRGEHGEPQS